MDVVSQLLIAALFSLHQYIPADSVETKYFEYSVDPITLESSQNGLTILAAAHSSCRHFFKVGEEEMAFDEKKLTDFLLTLIAQQETNLEEVKTNADQTGKMLKRLCLGDFDPQGFSRAEIASAQKFIDEQIKVLKASDLDSTGDYRFYGRVEMFDRNGKDMGDLFTLADQWIPYSQISPFMPQALIAAEDENFFRHDGVYLGSLLRMVGNAKKAAAANCEAPKDPNKPQQKCSNVTGGSTITMQLLKNMYFNTWPNDPRPEFAKTQLQTMLRKVREWYWAKPFEKYHEKLGPGSGKIYVLENYLNLMDYGPSIRGIDQASQVFFKKEPLQLDLGEASFLASMFKGPGIYARPRNYVDLTSVRKKYVLDQMLNLNSQDNGLGPITQAQYTEALAEELPQWEALSTLEEGTTPDSYLRTYAREFLNQEESLPKGMRAIESELTTTIDADLQKIVFDTVREHLDQDDRARETRDRITPARDDRSHVAIASEDDVYSDQIKVLKDLQAQLDAFQINVHIGVYLGETLVNEVQPNGQVKEVLRKRFYRYKKAGAPELPGSAEISLRDAFTAQARFVGQVLVAEISSERCEGLAAPAAGSEFKNLDVVLAAAVPVQTEEVVVDPADAVPVIEVTKDGTMVEVDPTDATVPYDLPPLPSVGDVVNIPLPRKRPENADEIIAAQKKARDASRFTALQTDNRPAVVVPLLPATISCARVIGGEDLKN